MKQKDIKWLELFAGSRSIGKAAEKQGHTVFSVDIKPFDGIDLVADAEFIHPDQIPFVPDVIWAGIPCTTWTMAAISHHRDGIIPKTEFAAKSDRMLARLFWLFEQFPDALWYIENPRAMLRKMPLLLDVPKSTVWYCRYGDKAAKPTDIFSNNIRSMFEPDGWDPRPPCYNGNPHCHHERAPRGSKTGTQGKSGNYERSKMPPELCDEIVMATEARIMTETQDYRNP